MDKDVKQIFNTEIKQLKKLKDIVNKSIEEQSLITENLLNPPKEILTRGQKISDKVAKFGGSWFFIISFLIILFFWITFNTISYYKFDEYPFILMNLILSCIAALQAPIIMMSQNRQEEKDRKRGENDYIINLKSELEIRSLNQKIDLLLNDQIKIILDSLAKQLEILKTIEKKLKS